MTKEFPEFPEKYAAKIHEIAVRKGMSDDEVVTELMRLLLDLADSHPDEDDSSIARRLRCALRKKFDVGSD